MIHRINRPQLEFYITINYCVAYIVHSLFPNCPWWREDKWIDLIDCLNEKMSRKKAMKRIQCTLCAISKWNELFHLIFPIVCFEIVYILCEQQLNSWKQQKNGLKKVVFESVTPCRAIVISVASQHICDLILSIILTACFSSPLNSSIVSNYVMHVSYDYHTYFRRNTKSI